MSNIIEHSLPCPDCGHKECYTIYDNGTYCFSCHKTTQKEGIILETTKLEIPLPMPLYNNTDKAYKWLYKKYFITKDMADKYNIGFSPKYTIFSKEGKARNMEKGLILPSYLDGEFLGYQAKQLSKNAGKLKYISQTNKGLVYITTQTSSNTKDLCITEDWLSAIRVGESMPALALGTTNISRKLLELVKQIAPDNIYIWLDPDDAGREGTQKVLEKLQQNLTNCKVCSIMEPCEPKECNPQELVNKLNNYRPKISYKDYIVDMEWDKLFKEETKPGFKWRLGCINKAAGDLTEGKLVMVVAAIDTGKTMFAISEATYMAEQAGDKKVLFFNNEEYDLDVLEYLVCGSLGKTREECFNIDAKKEYMLKTSNNLELYKAGGMSIEDITAVVNDHPNPGLIVIDLATKVECSGTQNERIKIRKVMAGLREIAKDVCPVIAVVQGASSTRWEDQETKQTKYKMYVHYDDVAEAKNTAESADLVIGLGRTEERSQTRFIYISKNKMRSANIKKEDRMLKQQVCFKPEICRYEDIE